MAVSPAAARAVGSGRAGDERVDVLRGDQRQRLIARRPARHCDVCVCVCV